ncbi:MAG TPA: hypothetical protein OIM42_08395, partial [Clostridiaceae bacterium]|nr:hypothetical protein [Clostridiaceae bacterium]
LQELEIATNYDGEYGNQELEEILNKKNIDSYEYTRYWHGYISLIRPLLLLFNIIGIRYIFNVIIIISLIVMAILIYKKLGVKICAIYILAFLGIDIVSMGVNMQGAICFLITILFNIILLLQKRIEMKKILNIFMVVRNVDMLFRLFNNSNNNFISRNYNINFIK